MTGLRAAVARLAVARLAVAGLLLAAAAAGLAQEAEAPEAPAPRASAPQPPHSAALADRTAVVAVLDKRMGTTAEFALKPGQRFTFGRLSGIMHNCERTPPHERLQSAAFVQVTEHPPSRTNRAAPKPKLVFSGWLFAESPSFNPFVHPVYDVWLRSCTMRFPDGPPARSGASRGNSGSAPATVPAATPVTPSNGTSEGG